MKAAEWFQGLSFAGRETQPETQPSTTTWSTPDGTTVTRKSFPSDTLTWRDALKTVRVLVGATERCEMPPTPNDVVCARSARVMAIDDAGADRFFCHRCIDYTPLSASVVNVWTAEGWEDYCNVLDIDALLESKAAREIFECRECGQKCDRLINSSECVACYAARN